MIVQYGVIPWRREGDGEVRILLITSRDTGRWVVPRGNPIAGLRPHEAGAQEAFEEAGIRGGVQPEEVGTYEYAKRLKVGGAIPAKVHLFPMLVTEEAESWPEKHERRRRWFSLAGAAEAVDEPELKALLLAAANWR